MDKGNSENTLKKLDVEIDCLREALYEVACDFDGMNSGEKVLSLSRKLDDLITKYIQIESLIDKSNN